MDPPTDEETIIDEQFATATMFEKLDIFNLKVKMDDQDLLEQDLSIPQKDEATTEQPVELHENKLTITVLSLQNRCRLCREKYRNTINKILITVLVVVLLAHFGYATYYFVENKYPDWDWDKGYGLYLVLCILAVIFILIKYGLMPLIGLIRRKHPRCEVRMQILVLDWKILLYKHTWIVWLIYLIMLFCIIAFLIYDKFTQPERLVGLAGYFVIIFMSLMFSKNIGLVKPRQVFCGITLQFVLALITIKLKIGREIFRVIGDRITLFLNYTGKGSRFAFGDLLTYETFTFAFGGLSTVYFLASCVNYLYYYNIVQNIVFWLGTALSYLLDTTIVESVNAAANIFFGITESPLLLKPYLIYLTSSELHAIAVAGFASVAGTIMGIYMSFGARADHLIIASVINPLTSLFFAKMLYPEDEISHTTKTTIAMPESDAYGALDALVSGAMNSVQLVLGIVANIMAFLTIFTILNQMVEWLGERVGFSDISLETLLAHVFMPLSFLLGIKWSECYNVGYLMATKSIINELVAYQKLGELKRLGKLSKRSVAISTFAIFGFSNPGTMGIIISAFYFLEPTQVHRVIKSILRSLICGTITCFSTACLIGMLLSDEDIANV